MQLNENIPYSKVVFKCTHNSYSPKIGVSIESQLDRGIRGIELDIHNKNIEHTRQFEIGHLRAGESVYHKEGNPTSPLFKDWLKVIKDWSDGHANHEPVTLFIDIKSNLVEKNSTEELILLNQTILENLTADKLYLPREFIAQDKVWPPETEMHNRIIVFLTGHCQSKWSYWTNIPKTELVSFFTYNYPDDNEKEYSKEMLQEAHIANAETEDWHWANTQIKEGKIVRLWEYNPRKFPFRTHIAFPLQRWPNALCSFPATDHPFKFGRGNSGWYDSSCEELQKKLLSA